MYYYIFYCYNFCFAEEEEEAQWNNAETAFRGFRLGGAIGHNFLTRMYDKSDGIIKYRENGLGTNVFVQVIDDIFLDFVDYLYIDFWGISYIIDHL